MKSVLFTITLLSTIILTSCNSQQKQKSEIDKLSVEMDSILRVAEVLDPVSRTKANELIGKYEGYSEKFPEDTLSPFYLMKASFLAGSLPDMEKQVKLLEEIAEKYPDSEYAPQALAIAAKSYTDNFKDLDKARIALEKLQKNYPASVYSVNIDLQIEYLGDDDGLFQAIMERNAAQDSINAVK